MDWTKVGAIANIGCFVFAGLTVALIIKPWPWWTKRESKPAHPLSRLIYVLVALGFIISGFTLWAAWHPTGFIELPQEQLQAVEDKQFVNDHIEIDGKKFNRCDFNNVMFRYQGKENATIENSHFNGTLAMGSDNATVQATMELVVIFLRESNLVDKQKVGFDHNHNLVLILPNRIGPN